MLRTVRTLLPPFLLIAVPIAAALVWGMSWALGDYPECGGGTYFLADAGWALQGIALGAVVALILPIAVTVRWTFAAAVGGLIVTGLGMVMAADAGARWAATSVGCDPFYVREAGEAVILGMVLLAIPTLPCMAVYTGIRMLRADRGPSEPSPSEGDLGGGWTPVSRRPRRAAGTGGGIRTHTPRGRGV